MSYLTPAEAAANHADWAAGRLGYLCGIGELSAARELARELPGHVKPLVAAKLAGKRPEALAVVGDELRGDEAPAGRWQQMGHRSAAFHAETARYERLIARLSR